MIRRPVIALLLIALTMIYVTPVALAEDKSQLLIEEGFKLYKEDASMAIAPDLEAELIASYHKSINEMSPDNFYSPKRAKSLIEFYKTPSGAKAMLKEWMEATTVAHWDRIFSIGTDLYLKVYFGSKDPNISPYFREDMLNKYATLLVVVKPPETVTQNTAVYLDDKFIGALKSIANGIRVGSNREYKLVIRNGVSVLCEHKFSLGRQETETFSCNTLRKE